jgi:predicted glycogen debranching enzyme
MKMLFNSQPTPDLEEWLSREYLLTNGLGGYASSTLADCPTRKYHGLLALPEEKTGKTILYLSKIETSILAGSHQYDFSTNLFPNSVFPEGYKHIQSVTVDGFPVTMFSNNHDELVLTKSVSLPRAADCVLIRYELLASTKPVILKLMPFLAYRDINGLVRQNSYLRPRTYFEPNGFKVDPYEHLPPLFLQTSKTSTFYPSPDWWKNFEYREERARGYDSTEDLFTPGVFEIKMKQGETVIIRAGLSPSTPANIQAQWDKEMKRLENERNEFQKDGEPLSTLKTEAEHFVTREPTGILAGFPWFASVWGRDALISLPGLLLARGRTVEALDLLSAVGALEKDGYLTNIISRSGDHAYNGLDASFLYFRAVRQYLDATGDRAGIKKNVLPVLIKILKAFSAGRAPNTRIGNDGLLYAGNEHTQLTWMDAQCRGRPVTPRHGAAVEINALYHEALSLVLDRFSPLLTPVDRAEFQARRTDFEKNFQTSFWNDDTACLCDVYRGSADRDPAIRPNQLFALTLPSAALDPELARRALETVKLHLVTPCGLRTLSPRDPDFRPEYRGSQDERDLAYHQGMVWPWLIGVYFDAMEHLTPDKTALRKYFRNTFSTLWEHHLEEGCVRQISEMFTPLPPHRACGGPAQAWSLAEVIRVLAAIA